MSSVAGISNSGDTEIEKDEHIRFNEGQSTALQGQGAEGIKRKVSGQPSGSVDLEGYGCSPLEDRMLPGPGNGRRLPQKSAKFKGRHIAMMAFGLSIGSGLIFTSGELLYLAGPASLLLGYITVGIVQSAVMLTLGEMISFLPVPGGMFTLANRCLSPAIGFACGWSYWLASILMYPNRLFLLANLISFWCPYDRCRPVIWISVFLFMPFGFNFFNIRRYGEIEFWLSFMKVGFIVVIIAIGILVPMDASNATPLLGTTDNGQLIECLPSMASSDCVGRPGFQCNCSLRTWLTIDWRQGAFKPYLISGATGRFLGFWAVCCQAFETYSGIEIVGIAADETENQREVLPKVVHRVSSRIFFYYVGAVFVLGLNVSSNDPLLRLVYSDASQSAFQLMIERMGFPFGLIHVGAVILIVGNLSMANAYLYVASRTLYALAREHQAPRIFLIKNAWGVPWVSLIVSSLPALLAYTIFNRTAIDVFSFLNFMGTQGQILSWAAICATYLRFRPAVNVQGLTEAIPKEAVSPLQPYLALYGLVWSSALVVFRGYEGFVKDTSRESIILNPWPLTIAPWAGLAVFILLFLTYVIMYGWEMAKMQSLLLIDLHNGQAMKMESQERKPQRSIITRAVAWVLDTL